jgi:hypothetical protein
MVRFHLGHLVRRTVASFLPRNLAIRLLVPQTNSCHERTRSLCSSSWIHHCPFLSFFRNFQDSWDERRFVLRMRLIFLRNRRTFIGSFPQLWSIYKLHDSIQPREWVMKWKFLTIALYLENIPLWQMRRNPAFHTNEICGP